VVAWLAALATVWCAGLAGAPATVAQTPPGTEIRNVATCAFTVPAPPGGRASETTVPSNPVITPVVRDDCFERIETETTVDPSTPAAPGDVLTFTVHWTVPFASDLQGVEVALAFDGGVEAPVELRVEFDPPPVGSLPPPETAWDSTRLEARWRLDLLPAGTTARFVAEVPIAAEAASRSRFDA
jgi:hypothetical protein